MSRKKTFQVIVAITIVVSFAAGCGHTGIEQLPAACRSSTSGSRSGLTPAPLGGGKCIVFGSVRDRDFYISLMKADGSGLTRLTEPTAMDWEPAWSPDGKRIAFTSNRGDANLDIYVMDADGSNRIRLTDYFGDDQQPAWSPDGTRIAFTSARDKFERDPDEDIYVMDSDGSHQTRLTDDPEDDWDPAWTPDGRIVFVSTRDGGVEVNGVRYLDGEIFVIDADGSNLVRLTDDQIHQHEPAWSPDGTRIAYTVSEGAALPSQIYVMNADGSNPTRLTDCPNGCSEPAWSPDGKQLAFSTFTGGASGHFVIYIMAADGTNPVQLTNDPVGGSHPAWQP